MADAVHVSASVGIDRHLFDERLTAEQMKRISELGASSAKQQQTFTSKLLSFNLTGASKHTAQQAEQRIDILRDLSENRTKNAVSILNLYFSKVSLEHAEFYAPAEKERLSRQIAEQEKTLRSALGLAANADLSPWKFGIPVESPEKAAAFVREKLILAHAADSVLVSLAAAGKLNAQTDNLAGWFRSALMDTPPTGKEPEAKDLIARFEAQLVEHETKYAIKLDDKTKRRIIDDLRALEDLPAPGAQTGSPSSWSLSFSPAGAATGFLGGAQFASYRRRLLGKDKTAAIPSASPEVEKFEAAFATGQFQDSAAILAHAREYKTDIEKRYRKGEADAQLYFDALQFESYASSQHAAAEIRRPQKAEDAPAPTRIEELSASEAVKRSIESSPHLRQVEAQSAAARANADRFKTGRAVKVDQTLGAGVGLHGVIPNAGVAIEFKPKTTEEQLVLRLTSELNELEASRLKDALTVRAFQAHAEAVRAQALKEKTTARSTVEEKFTGMVVDSAAQMAATQLRHLAGVEAGRLAAWTEEDHKAFNESQQRLNQLPKDILKKTAEYWAAVEALAAKNPKSDVLNLNTSQLIMPALAVAEGARFGVTGLINRLRGGANKELQHYAHQRRGDVERLLLQGKLEPAEAEPSIKQNDTTGLGSISAKEAFSVSAAIGIGAAALLKHNPQMGTLLAGNVGGSAAAAALSARLRSQPLLKPALYGALSGELMFAGEQLMADLVNVPGGGFLASGIESLGVSGVKNLVMNRGMFSRFEMPFGPVLFQMSQKEGKYSPSVSLMPENVGALALELAKGASFDVKASLQLATPVLSSDTGLTSYVQGKEIDADKIFLGYTRGGIITVDKSLAAVYGEKEATTTRVHERVHTFQHNKWGIIGEPLVDLLFPKGRAQWLSLDRTVGGFAAAPIHLLTNKFWGYRGSFNEQESWAWDDYQTATPDRQNALGFTGLAGAALALKNDSGSPPAVSAPAEAPALPAQSLPPPLLQLRYPVKESGPAKESEKE